MTAGSIGELVERVRLAARDSREGGTSGTTDREQLKLLAAQFESMLLLQMLRDMRDSGKWDEGSGEQGGLGAGALFETLDVELASHLSRAKGLGLSEQLLEAIEGSAGTRVTRTGSPAESGASGPGQAQGAAVAEAAPVRFAVADGTVTSSFGWRRDPFTGSATFHRGMDIRAAYGQDVQSAGGGRVVFSGTQSGYGTTIVIDHGGGLRTRYAHLSAALVQEGEQVGRGQVVGRAGRSGRATGTHLHFEVTRDGRHVDPADWGEIRPQTAS